MDEKNGQFGFKPEEDDKIVLSILKLQEIRPLNQPVNQELGNPQLDDVDLIKKEGYDKFSWNVNVGFESSKTQLGSRSQLNFSGGMQLNHAISKKFQIFGGVQYVIDRYRAERGEYKSTAKFFERSGDPDHTIAKCTKLDLILEFPIISILWMALDYLHKWA